MPSRRPVVSNTTPLITLAGVGILDILPALYSEIWIPQEVYTEYKLGREKHPESPDLDALSWLSVHAVSPDSAVSETLDSGESATIALARFCGARLVLLDERRGRREATRLGLLVAGSLSVLLTAKQHGLVPVVAPILDGMIAQGRRISVHLKEQVLELAGEM